MKWPAQFSPNPALLVAPGDLVDYEGDGKHIKTVKTVTLIERSDDLMSFYGKAGVAFLTQINVEIAYERGRFFTPVPDTKPFACPFYYNIKGCTHGSRVKLSRHNCDSPGGCIDCQRIRANRPDTRQLLARLRREATANLKNVAPQRAGAESQRDRANEELRRPFSLPSSGYRGEAHGQKPPADIAYRDDRAERASIWRTEVAQAEVFRSSVVLDAVHALEWRLQYLDEFDATYRS